MFSTDLNDNTADLKILFRMVNLAGQPGRDAMPTFTGSNFDIVTPAEVPEPATILMTATGLLGALRHARRRRRNRG